MTCLETFNRATERRIGRYDLLSAQAAISIAQTIRNAHQSKWRGLTIVERTDYLRSLAKALRSKHTEYAKLMTEEMGKPISQSEAGVAKCAWTADVYAENSVAWLADEVVRTDARLSYVTVEPLGVVL